MNRDSFVDQIRRLAEGFHHTLSPDRIDALWRKYRGQTEPVIRQAVDELLTDSRYPSAQRLETSVNQAADRHAEAERRRLHAQDRSSWNPDFESGSECLPLRARFYTSLSRWFFAQPQWPDWSAMETLLNDLAQGRIQVPGESPAEVDPPGDWRDFAVGIWQQNAPGTKPGELVSVLKP